MVFKKVLFVAPNFKNRKGGISSVLQTYSNSIENFKFFPSALFQNTILNFIFLPFLLLVFIGYLLSNPKIKIIHIHGASRGSFIRKYLFFLISKHLFRKKVIYHIHGAEYHKFYESSSLFTKRKINYLIKKSDKIIVLSKEWKEYFSNTFHRKDIETLNNIVPFVAEKENLIKDDLIKILFLGRIGQRKGTFDLLKVISDNKEKLLEKVEFIFGGDGEVDKFQKFVSENRLEKLVKYKGWVNGDQKIELLKQSNIMILPSYNEGLPISLLEAMSYSLPIISTNVGGIPQILKNKTNGILVSPGNIDEIRNAILYYLNNPELLNTHVSKSYTIVNNYYPKNVFLSLKNIYKSID